MYIGEFKNGKLYELTLGNKAYYIEKTPDGLEYFQYAETGDVLAINRENIIGEIKTPKTITIYTNICRDKYGNDEINGRYATREEADFNNYDGNNRIACVKLTTTYTDEQFDD